MNEILQYVNILLIPILGYLFHIERRLTKIETILKLKNICKND